MNYQLLRLLLCTQSRDRTGMEVNPLVFETSASTNSAIWAFVLNALQKYAIFLIRQAFSHFFCFIFSLLFPTDEIPIYFVYFVNTNTKKDRS